MKTFWQISGPINSLEGPSPASHPRVIPPPPALSWNFFLLISFALLDNHPRFLYICFNSGNISFCLLTRSKMGSPVSWEGKNEVHCSRNIFVRRCVWDWNNCCNFIHSKTGLRGCFDRRNIRNRESTKGQTRRKKTLQRKAAGNGVYES